MLPTVTIDGRLVADPELRFTQGGKAVCSLRVAASDSKKDEQGNWQTTEQIFIGVSLWENEAEAAANALQKGDQVVVTGRIFEREYDKNDGSKGKSIEVKYPTVAKKVSAPKTQRSTTPTPPANDPWATAPAGNDEPPFQAQPVDEHFPLSVRHATIEPGHDNKSAPGGARTPMPGASPTEIGHHRLMPNVPPSADSPPAICPSCGQLGAGHRLVSQNEAVPRAEYLCTCGALWITTWFTPRAGAA